MGGTTGRPQLSLPLRGGGGSASVGLVPDGQSRRRRSPDRIRNADRERHWAVRPVGSIRTCVDKGGLPKLLCQRRQAIETVNLKRRGNHAMAHQVQGVIAESSGSPRASSPPLAFPIPAPGRRWYECRPVASAIPTSIIGKAQSTTIFPFCWATKPAGVVESVGAGCRQRRSRRLCHHRLARALRHLSFLRPWPPVVLLRQPQRRPAHDSARRQTPLTRPGHRRIHGTDSCCRWPGRQGPRRRQRLPLPASSAAASWPASARR